MYKKDPFSGEIITTAGDDYYDNSLPYEGVSKIHVGRTGYTIWRLYYILRSHAHMLTLSTVVLIQVYINYIKKLLKVGFILVTIFVIASIGSQPRANLSLSLQCRCCYRDNCGRSDSSDLSAYASFASAQTKSAFVLVFPAPPIAVSIAQSRIRMRARL